jgi:hypothetical protein
MQSVQDKRREWKSDYSTIKRFVAPQLKKGKVESIFTLHI